MFNFCFCKLFSEVNPSRHIACELCDKSVHGGYDPIMNQVVPFIFYFYFEIKFLYNFF